MKYRFHKLQALGNDYVYFENFSQELPIEKIIEKTPQISERRFGVGSDGVILVLQSNEADAQMRIFNADGSEAEMCGNGLRSSIRLLKALSLVKKDKLKVDTLSGIMEGEVRENGQIKVKLAFPPRVEAKTEKANSEDEEFDFFRVDVGNPHAVIEVEKTQNFPVEKYGRPIENNLSLFPERTNVEFIEHLKEGEINMRVWERGSGETLACGTGAAASAAVHRKIKGENIDHVLVHLRGGDLSFSWKGEEFFMEGPAEFAFSGEVEI